MSKEQIREALNAAAEVTNEWLRQNALGLRLELVDQATVKVTVERFTRGARRKVSHWNWETFYYKQVKGRPAWMFDLRRGDQPVVMCLGTVRISGDYVALEYLERRKYARARGVALAASFQFALAVAGVMGLTQVRLNNPLNLKLARYYERELNMTPVRQAGSREVQFLYINVQP